MMRHLPEQLARAGLSAGEIEKKHLLFQRVEAALRATGPRPELPQVYYVPGRIEVLGKHTDYAGGRSLLCAAERGFCMVACPRKDSQIRIWDVGRGVQSEFPFAADLTPADGHWSKYPMTVMRRVAQNFPSARRGLDIAFASDLPSAAGLSSSSALMIAIFLAVADANCLAATDEYQQCIPNEDALAGYISCVENGQSFGALAGDRGVGTQGGSEDHTAILRCEPGYLSLYSFCPICFQQLLAWPKEYQFIVAATGVQAEKTGNAREAYNRAAATAWAVLDLWNSATGRGDKSLAMALTHSIGGAEEIRQVLRRKQHSRFSPQLLLDRFEQFVDESAVLVPSVAAALERQDWKEMGGLVDRSQANAERWLGNQIPETMALARGARSMGAVAASAFGAGFGGSVWAMVAIQDAGEFLAEWAERYRREFPVAAERAQFFATRPGPAANRLFLVA